MINKVLYNTRCTHELIIIYMNFLNGNFIPEFHLGAMFDMKDFHRISIRKYDIRRERTKHTKRYRGSKVKLCVHT